MNETLYIANIVVPVTAAPIYDGAVHVRDGRILNVGTRETVQRLAPKADLVNFGRAILMPPLVNAHTHLELTDFGLWQEEAGETSVPADFAEWILHVIKVKRDRCQEDYLSALKSGIQQSLAAGTGVIVDILSQPELADVYKGTPLFGRVDCELIGRDKIALTPLLKRAEQWLAERTSSGLDRGLSPHSPYTVTAEILAEIVVFAEARRAALSIHTAESSAEIELLQQSCGVLAEKLYPAVGWQAPEPPMQVDPVSFLDAAGAIRPSSLLVHAVHLSADEIGRIGRVGSSVVLCPRSNEHLGTGTAPVEQFICRDINLILGTDSLASNDSLSIWDEMEAARRVYGDDLSPVQVVAMATFNGAAALGLADEIGALKPDAGAHFLVLKPDELPSRDDLAEFLCRGERQQEITHLFLNGVDVLPMS